MRSSATAWLTAAVVDDAGRLIDVCDISDDPVGYAELGALLAERSGGTAGIAVASDSGDHQVTLLLAAAGRPLALAEEDSLDDYAERFCDDESLDEVQAPVGERRAVGLARALQAGALAASPQGAPRELMALKPVLAAHAALATGRQGAAMALREVLRELYPAALRAYPDPAEPIPLAILDAIPEPGMLTGPGTQGREAAVASALADAGVADLETVTSAITSLRVAIGETPRRAGIGKTLTAAVADTIRHAVAAVRACDSGVTALVGLLAEKATPVAPPAARPATMPAAPAHSAPATPAHSAPAASAPLRAVRERTAEHAVAEPGRLSEPMRAGDPLRINDLPRISEPVRLAPDIPAPGSRSDWPLNTSFGDQVTISDTGSYAPVRPTEPAVPPLRYGRVTPPWQADDLPTEPPALRLVEPASTGERPTVPHYDRDPLGAAPPLRLVESGAGTSPLDQPMSPPNDDGDGDLLIFAQTRSAWFTWNNPAALGWQAAERATSPILGDETSAGLPRRVPQANLVPGSPLPPASERPLRIVRDPAAMAQHTTGYFRGSRRGEEVRGFALGGRPGREAASGWDFSRDGYENDDNPDRGYEYRSAARR